MRRRPNLFATWGQRILVVVMLFSYFSTAIGMPLLPLPVESGGIPFPCQGHACGCANAQQCWAHCCCMSREERLAWAVAHNVEPPKEFFDAAPTTPPVKKTCSHCTAHSQSQPNQSHSSEPERQSPETKSSFVYGIAAQQCHGLSTVWVTLGSVLPLQIKAWVERDNISQPHCFQFYLGISQILAPPPAPPPEQRSSLECFSKM